MTSVLTPCWRALVDYVERARERRLLIEARCALRSCACSERSDDEPRKDEATRADRLTYIALYAQAGYFGVGYPIDLFQPPFDLPLR
jgi:hypothetical protein